MDARGWHGRYSQGHGHYCRARSVFLCHFERSREICHHDQSPALCHSAMLSLSFRAKPSSCHFERSPQGGVEKSDYRQGKAGKKHRPVRTGRSLRALRLVEMTEIYFSTFFATPNNVFKFYCYETDYITSFF